MQKLQLSDEQWIPARFTVCGRCRGEGTHTNPAIDGNGITQSDREDWADDEFMEGYLSGRYDVTCEECKGERVVLVADKERCTPAQFKAWEQEVDEKRQYEAERQAEIRMDY